MSSYFEHSELIWSPKLPNASVVENLRRHINRKHGLNLKDYHELYAYSVNNYSFWLDLWECLGIISSVPPKTVVADGVLPEIPTWFPEARLNYAENLLFRNDDAIAISAGGESGVVTHYSFRTLRGMVREMAAALRCNGLVVGDRVAGIITNSVHAVAIALATASIGGIFSSTAPDMGTQGILDRYRQIKPKFLFSETSIQYSGKTIDLVSKVTEVIRDLKGSLQAAVLLPSSATHPPAIDDAVSLEEFLRTGDGRELTFEQLPFNQPLFILYSSGTSGPPKCIVHSAGGALLQPKKDLSIGLDIRFGDTYFQFTTTGWMMWTFMLTGLACGARIILYDGSPFYPNVQQYLKFIDNQGVSHFGTSPRFLSEVQGRGVEPLKLGRFDALRTMGVTGAVLTPPLFRWAQEAFGHNTHLVSTSGGTDICAAFITGSPTLPVYTGEMSCKSLGMKVEVWDPSGKNIEHLGEAGELVCTRPHPSIPVRFWGDSPDHKKLRATYFEHFKGVWQQGDFIVVNPQTKGLVILGRSDGVLNPSGVRFGSGEIYTVMDRFSDHIDDCICVGQRRQQDDNERVLLFIKLRAGSVLTKSFKDEIKQAIRTSLSPRHVPAFIFAVDDIPYTVNGKKIEIAVKQIISGSFMKPSGTVANPESLKLYYEYQDIEKFGHAKTKM